MILNEQKQSTVLQEGDVNESIGMSLDLDSAQFLMQTLSKNLYSDEIGSTIRETCSNALDSHRKAGVKEPIIVCYEQNKDGNYEFSVEDFGVGLDDDDVRNIISKYGKSTRRGDANALGMWGLGFKAPLAYSSSFYFITRKDGVERKYMMYEGEETNTIDLLYDTPTTERNGVKVIVPVAFKDRSDFVVKIKEQLAYFEDVYFSSSLISNNFVIVRAKEYQLSTMVTSKFLHICLDNVYYPIDFQKLGIPTIEIPVGLRFGLSDGIFPIPSRESIRYTPEAKTAIINKIKIVATTLVEEYNKTINEVDHISKVFDYYSTQLRTLVIDTIPLNVGKISSFSSVKIKQPTLKNVKLIDLEELYLKKDSLIKGLVPKMKLYRNKISTIDKGSHSINTKEFMHSKNYFFFDENISGVKKEYLKTLCSYYDYVYFVKVVNDMKLGYPKTDVLKTNYYNVLKLRNYPKSQWRDVIKEFQAIRDSIYSTKKKIDDIVVPQSFIDSRKVIRASYSNKREKYEGNVLCKQATALERYMSSQYCKFVPVTLNIASIEKYKGMIIYGNYDDSSKLDDLYQVCLSSSTSFKILSMSDREKKIMDKLNIHNLITIEEFMKGDNKPFKRFVTAFIIDNLTKDYKQVFYKRDHLKEISTTLYDKLALLDNYRNKNLKYADPDILKSMLEIAEKNKLFDEEIYYIYLEIRALLSRLTFLEPMMEKLTYRYPDTTSKDKLVPVLVDLFKYYKCRIDYSNYKITLNKEEVFNLDELLGDAAIEELIEESNN